MATKKGNKGKEVEADVKGTVCLDPSDVETLVREVFPGIGSDREAAGLGRLMGVQSPGLFWLAVRVSLGLALRHPGISDVLRGLLTAFCAMLGQSLVEIGALSEAGLAAIERNERQSQAESDAWHAEAPGGAKVN